MRPALLSDCPPLRRNKLEIGLRFLSKSISEPFRLSGILDGELYSGDIMGCFVSTWMVASERVYGSLSERTHTLFSPSSPLDPIDGIDDFLPSDTCQFPDNRMI
jgi:hypothetical protein